MRRAGCGEESLVAVTSFSANTRRYDFGRSKKKFYKKVLDAIRTNKHKVQSILRGALITILCRVMNSQNKYNFTESIH